MNQHVSQLRVLMLTAYPDIGGPLPKLAPLVAEGLRLCDCDVVIEGWSAHHAGHEPLAAKLVGRTADLLRVHRRIRAWRPDVVYVATAHNWPGLLRDLQLALTVRRGRPPLVLHLHGSECGRLGQPGQEILTALSILLARRASSVMLLSTEEMRSWRRTCPHVDFGVVVNPFVAPQIDQERQARRQSDAHSRPPILLTVARLIPEKGVFDLLDALAIVRRSRPCRLLVAGTGPARDDLVRRIATLQLEDAVDLLGYVSGPQLEETYRRADLFVLPTYFAEGFPLSIMEAMSQGCPSSRLESGAPPTSSSPGSMGYSSPGTRKPWPRRSWSAGRRPLRARMAQANVDRVAEFAPERVIPRYAEILHAAAQRPQPRRRPIPTQPHEGCRQGPGWSMVRWRASSTSGEVIGIPRVFVHSLQRSAARGFNGASGVLAELDSPSARDAPFQMFQALATFHTSSRSDAMWPWPAMSHLSRATEVFTSSRTLSGTER